MNARKLLGWVVVIFIVFYIVTSPTQAAHAMTNLLNLLKTAGNSLAIFFNSL